MELSLGKLGRGGYFCAGLDSSILVNVQIVYAWMRSCGGRSRDMALETETKAFEHMLDTELAGHQGKYALVIGHELAGTYEAYTDALNAGYEKAGLAPFLVKQVTALPAVANFTRDFLHCTQPA